jgi:BirA family biotin operon repressor/biotin-[acetyl-CoA-carboxylase] ligase
LLRPDAAIGELLTLTGWVAVAVRGGIEAACGAPVEIKWLNDIYLNGRKLVGVLTELSLTGESSEADYVVVGIGVNVSQSGETFRAQGLEDVATSLAAEGYFVERNRLAAAVLDELDKLCLAFPHGREGYLEEYRRHCLTLGRTVAFEKQGRTVTGVARRVDEQFALVIHGGDGQTETVTSGTVTLV